ncbi:MAG TPA: hypothetical protein VNM47_04170 [Terriglobia bacterium]|nr:hypothetical protein [Terriglobia bacterium]
MNYSSFVPQFWDRDELYKDVWNQPLTSLTAKYGVSAVAIGKVCRKLRVPLPGRGYWAKKAHGHAVKQKPLPALHEVPRIQRYQRPFSTSANSGLPPKPEFPVEEEDRAEIDRISQQLAAGVFVVKSPRKILRHPLIVATRNTLLHGLASKQICLPLSNQYCLNIRFSRTSLRRALAVMAAIISILEDNGVKIRVTPGDRSYSRQADGTSATIFGEKVLFGISEKIRHVRVPDPDATPNTTGRERFVTKYEPTGKLSIRVLSDSDYFTTIWSDSEQTNIESLLPECIATMMKIAVEYRRRTAKRRQEELFRKLRGEELGRLKGEIEAEEARVARLESGATNWQRARRIREYVIAVAECRKEQGKELGPDTALGRWVAWALQQADRIDPLAESPVSILDRKAELEGWSPYNW